MNIIIGALCLLSIAGLAWLFWMFHHAPEGFQDENGFQYGKHPPKEPPDNVSKERM